MDLETYLNALLEFTDKPALGDDAQMREFCVEFGLSDNWPILLCADFEVILYDLRNSPSKDGFQEQYGEIFYKHVENPRPCFGHVPGIIFFDLKPMSPDYKDHLYPDIDVHLNVNLMLHPALNCITDLPWEFANPEYPQLSMAKVIIDIGMYAKNHGLSLCFPRSTRLDNRGDKSRVVQYIP